MFDLMKGLKPLREAERIKNEISMKKIEGYEVLSSIKNNLATGASYTEYEEDMAKAKSICEEMEELLRKMKSL